MRIQTERLRIRNYEERDLPDFFEIFSDPVVMEHCEPPYDMEASRDWVRYFIDHPIAFAVVEMESDKMIGHALFKQMSGEADGVYEIGWIYNRRFWRRGYACEAARALISHGFDELSVHKIVAETVDPVKSASLMKKLGMREEGVFRQHTLDNSGRWADLYWYGLLKSDRRA